MRKSGKSRKVNKKKTEHARSTGKIRLSKPLYLVIGIALIVILVLFVVYTPEESPPVSQRPQQTKSRYTESADAYRPTEKWLQRAYAIGELFHKVYTPCWEGAYGAMGDVYLFAVTNDSSLLRFHTVEHDMKKMCTGTWVDDRAWVCLAELYWWDITGRNNMLLVADATRRYAEAKEQGRLSNHDGYWSWYNWPPNANVNERIFTNSNMNQMVSVACRLYEATGDSRFLNDALLVWNGDADFPGIEKTLYRGEGVWKGNPGRAAFGKELPWGGTSYCSIGASLYRVTGDPKFKNIAVATAKRIIDPATGWVDPQHFYQIHMDGNGNFVHFLLDAYEIAPDELQDIPDKIENMLEHVWTNHYGRAAVTLHRESDHGIRNGWNPFGGEDGYNVDEVGTVHAQAEALRAFGVFAYFKNVKENKFGRPLPSRQ
jgi:hypothetical protein